MVVVIQLLVEDKMVVVEVEKEGQISKTEMEFKQLLPHPLQEMQFLQTVGLMVQVMVVVVHNL